MSPNACPCGGLVSWRVHTLRDHYLHPIHVAFGWTRWRKRAFGRYELSICDACGTTKWYARNLPSPQLAARFDILTPQKDDLFPCEDCGGAHYLTTQLYWCTTDDKSLVEFVPAVSAQVCATCSRVNMRVRVIRDALPSDARPAPPCTRCQAITSEGYLMRAPHLRSRPPLLAWRSNFLWPSKAGEVSMRLCMACRNVSWVTYERNQLRHAWWPHRGLERIERPATASDEAAENVPYR